MESKTFRKCPGCSSVLIKKGTTVSSSIKAEELATEELVAYWRGYRPNQVFFSYVRCSNCQLLYCPKYFDQKDLDNLYSNMGDNTGGELVSVVERTQTKYVKSLDRFLASNSRWLDLGADIGLTAKAIQLRQPTSTVDALEPNTQVHDQLRVSLGSHSTIFSDWNEIPRESYDGVLAVHVADHLLDVVERLKAIRSWLKPNGVIAIVVHNEQSILSRVMGARWPAYCLQHPHLFNQMSIRETLKHSGFESLLTLRTSNYFRIGHLLDRFLSVMGWQSLIKLVRFFPFYDKVIPLKLGNLLVVAVRTDGG